MVDEGRVVLCLSAETLAEVRDVLTRPKTLGKFPRLSREWVDSFVKHLELKGLLVPEVPHVVTLSRDPKDEACLNLAVAAGARYLVSRDLDLLDLMKDESFRMRHPTLLILEPPVFLQNMTGPRTA